MKCIKNCLIASVLFFAQQELWPNPQQPFSPCNTDIPVIIQNNFKEALGDLCKCIQSDVVTRMPQATPENPDFFATQNSNAQKNNTEKLSDITKANIKIRVNNLSLKPGQKMRINVSDNKPLMISVTGDLWTLINYLIKFDLLSSYSKKSKNSQTPYMQNGALKRIKDWTTGFIKYTYCLFDTDDAAEAVYEQNKAAILLAYAKAYRNTYGLFGGTLTIEVPIAAAKLKNEIIVDKDNPMVDFYDILDIVINRLNEPEHIKYTGSLYNPVIQII